MLEENLVQIQDGYCYQRLLEDLEALKFHYPEIEISSIGHSVLGRHLPTIRIGTGSRQIHYNGAFHANEWITSLLLMVFMEKYLQANQEKNSIGGVYTPDLFQKNSLWIVPMVNPDGIELVQNGFSGDHPYYREILQANNGSTNFRNWKANIRGVDLNDQFPAHWERESRRRETNGPAPLNYPGPSPLSEPEAKAMADFTQENDFRLVIAFHTQGEEIYWGYEHKEPPESLDIIRRFQKVSGYRAVRYVDSDAGYKDWFIDQWCRPGFTVECGHGQNPLPINQFSSMYVKAESIMIQGLLV